jgi:hypothetical protein
MGKREPLTVTERAYILTRKQAGASLATIGAELGCAAVTVRKWWRRRGQAAVARGRPRRGNLSSFAPDLVEAAVDRKRTHPHWGPANVKVDLQQVGSFQHRRLPSDARLSALFAARCPEAVQPRQRRLYPGVGAGGGAGCGHDFGCARSG